MNERGIADDVVNVCPVLVDAVFDKIVGDSRMGVEHKLVVGA